MPDENIKFEHGKSTATISSIREDIESKLNDKKTEYDSILAGFTVSEGMQAEALRSMIAKEKDTVSAIVSFYKRLLLMLESAGNAINKTEKAYSTTHLTKE